MEQLTPVVHVAEDAPGAARQAMEHLDRWGAEALASRPRVVISLAGGSTPAALYRLWAAESRLDWPRVELVFGDERCVPPDHPDSNAGMATRNLLEALASPPRIHRMMGEAPPPQAALDYQDQLHRLLGETGRLDAALLGIGPDGHTASLFPGRPALNETSRWVVDTLAPDGKTARLTLTFPLLAAARHVAFLAVGEAKAPVLRAILEGPYQPDTLPCQRLLRPEAGLPPPPQGPGVHLFVDRAAAPK
ncbi:MAG: 6-phosphogluconolactonase [Deltaproteobacteria bacterium]|nr:6-phosphogluconolactonase [Deltaproteobacteria bacterium]